MSAQSYQTEPWPDLVNLWLQLNRHLLHVVNHVPENALSHTLRIGGRPAVPLSFAIQDYVAHLEHHLSQIPRPVDHTPPAPPRYTCPRPLGETMKLAIFLAACAAAFAQEHQHAAPAAVPLQPLALQVRQLEEALAFLGQPLSPADHRRINDAIANPDQNAAVAQLQSILDAFALVTVEINPEGRVKVEQGAAKPELVEAGARLFLVKVVNNAHVTSQLNVESPKAATSGSAPTAIPPRRSSSPRGMLPTAGPTSRFISARPCAPSLRPRARIRCSRHPEPRCRTARRQNRVQRRAGKPGHRLPQRRFHRFQRPPVARHHAAVKDENGQPAMASFVIRDRQNRLYPSPAKRLAPDFYFQPQIYRADGESVQLPAGYYTVQSSGGPEYLPHTREFAVDAAGPREVSFQLERWIDPAKLGWYSGDHHVHAAGCSHYMNPTEGVQPKDMIRQLLGERLNIGSVLTWGPDYYYQKQFFSGKDDPLSKPDRLMHYDLEVSGFPSSHAGHIILLNLKQQDYPERRRSRTGPPGTPPSSAGPNRRAPSSATRTPAGVWRSPARNCPPIKCPASTASAPMSSSSM